MRSDCTNREGVKFKSVHRLHAGREGGTHELTNAVLVVNIMHLIHSKPFLLIQFLLLHRHDQKSKMDK